MAFYRNSDFKINRYFASFPDNIKEARKHGKAVLYNEIRIIMTAVSANMNMFIPAGNYRMMNITPLNAIYVKKKNQNHITLWKSDGKYLRIVHMSD